MGPGQIPRTDQVGHPLDVRLSHLLRQDAAPRLVPLGAELIVTEGRSEGHAALAAVQACY